MPCFLYKAPLVCLTLLLSGCSSYSPPNQPNPGPGPGTYSTTFPLTENPISQGGNWVNGKTVGLDWGDVQTVSGLAFGTTTTPFGQCPGTPGCNDSTAVLTGTWASDQTASGVVSVPHADTGPNEEVELRLRTTIAAHSITGYEINCSVIASNPYMQVVRWNGALDNFTVLATETTTGCANGDIIKATAAGSTITVSKNGTNTLSATDSTFLNGSPGIGFFMQGGTTGQLSDYGFSSFTASGLGQKPNAPTGLTAIVN